MIIEKEIEIKLQIQDFANIEIRLKKLGFSSILARSFEKNLVFDTPAGDLMRNGSLLRLRQQGDAVYLTFKQPKLEDKEMAGFKIREEIEIKADNFQKVEALLTALDYQTSFVYEKYRTTFKLGPVMVMFDETPIGKYIEIEGPPREIDKLAKSLGFSKGDYITATYYDLFLRKGTGKNMCFQ